MKYSGKLLTVNIAPSGVRVCEGSILPSGPKIDKFFVVTAEEYFTSTQQQPEIINMSGLVSAIVTECNSRHVISKRVMVCSDCFGILTEVIRSEASAGLKGFFSADLGTVLKNKKKKNDKTGKTTTSPDKVVHKESWGELMHDGSVSHISTTSTGDKFLLKSLVNEFYSHGYEVIFISGAQEVLLNFWQTEPSSFDSQGKVIFDYDVFCGISIFHKDIPVEITRADMGTDQQEITRRMVNQLAAALPQTGRNPRIYIAGSAFSSMSVYCEIVNYLEAQGYTVFDLFNHGEVDQDYEFKLSNGDVEPLLTPDYMANIALFMCGMAKHPISLTPAITVSESFHRNAQSIATIMVVLALAASLSTGGLAAWRGYELYEMENNPSQIANLNAQIATLTSKQQSLNSTIKTLTEADTTVLELMNFIESNQTDRVCVVSMDTRDMLPDSLSVDTTNTTVATQPIVTTPTTGTTGTPTDPNSGVITGTAGDTTTAPTRENIIIRGYAKTGNEAVAYYNKLFQSGISVDPVLNGVERYELPDATEVYIFEIEIGGLV